MRGRENRIPMLDLAAQQADIKEELLAGFATLIDTGRFVLGDPVESFESDLAKLCEARHALSCNSGTDALWLALRGLGIGAGDAVLCPAYSFFATAATIVRAGATPIFVDIDPATFNLDPGQVLNYGTAETGGDFTGTEILATAPIAVFGGHECARRPQ